MVYRQCPFVKAVVNRGKPCPLPGFKFAGFSLRQNSSWQDMASLRQKQNSFNEMTLARKQQYHGVTLVKYSVALVSRGNIVYNELV